MRVAFESGDPRRAFQAAGLVATRLLELDEEAARLRFQVNFGTPICTRCDGLRAGPGVVATCFQVRRCRYTNVKEGDTLLDLAKRFGVLPGKRVTYRR